MVWPKPQLLLRGLRRPRGHPERRGQTQEQWDLLRRHGLLLMSVRIQVERWAAWAEYDARIHYLSWIRHLASTFTLTKTYSRSHDHIEIIQLKKHQNINLQNWIVQLSMFNEISALECLRLSWVNQQTMTRFMINLLPLSPKNICLSRWKHQRCVVNVNEFKWSWITQQIIALFKVFTARLVYCHHHRVISERDLTGDERRHLELDMFNIFVIRAGHV